MKIRFLNILITETIFLFIFLFNGCSTSTTVTSWQDFSEKENQFSKIFVMVLIRDLEYRIILENKVVSELNKTGIRAVQSLKKLSPVDRYTKDDFDTLLLKNNFDGFLMIKYEGSIEQMAKRDGMKYYKYYRKFSRPIRRKGYIESHKTIILESILFSVLSEKNVWAATTKTLDSSGAEDLAQSYCEAILRDLKNKNLLK